MLHMLLQGRSPQATRSWSRLGLAVVVALLAIRTGLTLPTRTIYAQEKAAGDKAAADEPLGQFVTVSGTIDAKEFGKVSRVAKNLAFKSREQKRKGILVLEFGDGPSRFGDVRELAKFLSEQLPEIRTVAWLPKDVRGYNVIAVLACNEIVMHPRAGLGDLGRGKPVDEDVKTYVETLISRRHNPLLTPALVHGMMDPKEEVIWVRRQPGLDVKGISETDLVTPPQFQRLMDAKAIIIEHKTIKAAGSVGLFNGAQARSGNYLCTQTAEARVDIAKIYNLPREALRENPTLNSDLVARRIRIDGMITPLIEEFIHRQIDRMVGEGANLLIFEIESPNGYLPPSMQLANIIADLDQTKIRTVAYVPRQALSGAAIVALGCDDIVMHPDARIGDLAPVDVQQNGLQQDVLGVTHNVLDTLAVKKGRPKAICLAMASKDLTVFRVTNETTGDVGYLSDDEIHAANGQWVKGERVDESGKGSLLIVNGKRAQELQIAEEPVANFDELKQRYSIPAEESLPAVAPNWVDSLVFLLNDGTVTGFLFVVGIICIYAELHVPSGLFLVISCMCFGLFFWSRFLGGTAGWLEVMLFLLGIGCISVEVFVVPGFGVFGVSGALMVLGSLVLASQTFFIPTSSADYHQLADHLSTLGGSLVGVIITAFGLSRFLPRMPLLNRMVLVPPGAAPLSKLNEPQLRPELTVGSQYGNSQLGPFAWLLGERGSTLTILRPSGKVQFGDRLVDVLSDGPYIEAGRQVQVIEVNGNRVVVREVA